MKKFIIKIILILLPAVIFGITLELLARDIPTSYSAKDHNLSKKKEKIEVLVLGSSHANFGINPEYFGREAFNISNTSQGLYQDYKVLLKYLPQCKKLKMVIVPISYFTLQSELAMSPEAWRCSYYSVYMGVQANPSSTKFDLKNYSALFLWDGPLGVIKGIRKTNKLDINEYGYQSPPKSKTIVEELINDKTGKERVGFHDKIMKKEIIESNVSVLNEIAKDLSMRNIKMVIVTPPVYKTYYENILQENYDLMTSTIDVIAEKHQIKIFNYFKDKRFEMNDFMDNDHLNEDGARKFSYILKNEVVDNFLLK
jgi:hypothetical protein